MKKFDKINEKHGVWIMAGVAALAVGILAVVLPPTIDGMNYFAAISDSFGLRLAKLAAFDLHSLGVLYFYGGRNWNITQLFKTKPISTSIILAAIFIGTAMMLM